MDLARWIEEQEGNTLFRGGDGNIPVAAKPMLEISATNRIVNLQFARLAVAVRLAGNLTGGRVAIELNKLVDVCEAYQLTIGEPKNSREAFVEAIKAQFTHYLRSRDIDSKGKGII